MVTLLQMVAKWLQNLCIQKWEYRSIFYSEQTLPANHKSRSLRKFIGNNVKGLQFCQSNEAPKAQM